MGLFTAFDICSSGMTAQRLRYDTIAENLANVNTTRTTEGGPYRRKTVVFTEKHSNAFQNLLLSNMGVKGSGISGTGVKVSQIVDDTETQMNMVYDPAHPDADENGYVRASNVNAMVDIADALMAQRAYEANLALVNISKSMAQRALEIGK